MLVGTLFCSVLLAGCGGKVGEDSSDDAARGTVYSDEPVAGAAGSAGSAGAPAVGGAAGTLAAVGGAGMGGMAVCEPTAAMLADDLRSGLEKPGAEKNQESRPPVEIADDADGNFNRCYQEIEQALTAAIGPVAKMVMSDCVGKWREKGSASTRRLPELMDILAQEIDDPSLVADFRIKLQHMC